MMDNDTLGLPVKSRDEEAAEVRALFADRWTPWDEADAAVREFAYRWGIRYRVAREEIVSGRRAALT